MHPSYRIPLRSLRQVLLSGLSLVVLATGRAQPAATAYVFTHFAGTVGGPGNSDGTGPAARFLSPNGVAMDRAGNTYVADTGNHTIRKITPTGTVTTVAGTPNSPGSADGAGPAARFSGPQGVAVDGSGNLFVVDTGNHVVRKVTPDGIVTTVAGTPGRPGNADGTGSAARFYIPVSVVVDVTGNLFVADLGNFAIRKITPDGVVTTFAGMGGRPGGVDGTGSDAGFSFLGGLAIDGSGNLYVADTAEVGLTGYNNETGYTGFNSVVRKITPAAVVTTLAATAGHNDNTGLNPPAPFPSFNNVAVDGAGNLYTVAAGYLNSATEGAIRKITPDGVATILAGTAGTTGASVAVDSAGNLVIADPAHHTIREYTAGGNLITLAGMAAVAGSADAIGTVARFDHPAGITLDPAGNLLVTDALGTTLRKLTPAGVVTTLAGTAGKFGRLDGTGAAAQFWEATSLAVDGTGTISVTDGETVRKVTPEGVVTSLPRTLLYFTAVGVKGLTADAAGNLYFTDVILNTINKIAPDLKVSRLAGLETTPPMGGSTDGTGAEARFSNPTGVGLDTAGNLYVADTNNCTIRKITPAGVVTTLAGTAGQSGSLDGTGPAARFTQPLALAVDKAANVYVTDVNTIRKITPDGVVTTIGGTAGVTGSADGLGAAAQFNGLSGITVDAAGNVYVTDSGDHSIRKGQPAGPPVITTQPQNAVVAPGGTVQLAVAASSVLPLSYQWYFNGSPFSGGTDSSLGFTNARGSDSGDYTVVVTNAVGNVTSSKATLTVSTAFAPGPMPAATATGGGGSLEGWLAPALLALVAVRHWRRAGIGRA